MLLFVTSCLDLSPFLTISYGAPRAPDANGDARADSGTRAHGSATGSNVVVYVYCLVVVFV